MPYSYTTAPNNTTELLSVNVLSLIQLFGKIRPLYSNCKSIGQRCEEANYIDQMFSKQKVVALTGLKGDSLQNFMELYRPAIKDIKKLTAYDLMQYIKKSYTEFMKTTDHEKQSVFKN